MNAIVSGPKMGKNAPVRPFPILGLLVALSCGRASRPSDAVAVDVEIERAILWELRDDARFKEIQVRCQDRVAWLRGTVSTAAVANEALSRARKAARAQAYGAEVRSEIRSRSQ